MRPDLLSQQAVRASTESNANPGQLTPVVSYRHRYKCWACECEGVLEFEPDALEPSWTECHHCGIDNEIPPGVYVCPAVIPGHVPARII